MRRASLLVGTVVCLCLISSVSAQLAVPSDGTDGALNITVNTTIDLGEAITGNWDDPVPSEDMGNGIYDPSVWAVVYKYESVSVSGNRTLSFTNHPSGAPVVWLVDGPVNIAGTVNLSGSGQYPGPGGFYGGRYGAGLGPGGALDTLPGTNGAGASYASLGEGLRTGEIYGNAKIFPLIGGSGGSSSPGYAGGGGGGALLIATDDTVTVDGLIVANAGDGISPAYSGNHSSGGGSGGGIRIIANHVSGNGSLQAKGGRRLGSTGASHSSQYGGDGRIRLECFENSMLDPGQPTASFGAPDEPALIFPDENTPVIRSIRLGGRDVPADPKVLTYTPGLTFEATGDYTLEIEASMVPSDAEIEVRLTPGQGEVQIFNAGFVSGNLGSSLWMATVTLPEGRMEIQARAILSDSSK